MNRAQLECALRALSSSLGYHFYLLPADRIAEVKRFPAAVLEPPTVASVEGRGHGRISYNFTLHLLGLAAKLSTEEQCALSEKMESDLLDICSSLSEDEQVIVVDGVGITPREYAFTTHGEISQTARAKAVLYF